MEIARLNNYNNSPEEAFEALSVQLFQRWLYRSDPNDVTYFSVVNGAGGDGGVEAYGVLKNGAITGVQAKYFTNSLTSKHIGQIEKSVRTAKEVRGNLKHYIVCLPRKKFSDKKGKDGKITQVSEEKKVLNLAAKINHDLPDVELEFWFEDKIQLELAEPGNDGIKKFWFDKEEISLNTLRTRFALAKTGWLNERYVPDLHHAGKITGFIDQMLFTDSYIEKEISSISEIKREVEEAFLLIDQYITQNLSFPDVNQQLTIIRTHLIEHLTVFDRLIGDLQQAVYRPKINIPADFDIWALIMKIEGLPKINLLRNITPRLLQSLKKVHRIYLVQYWEHLNKEFHPHNYSILGPVGTGKTHALANATEMKLEEGQAALIIRAKDTPNENWGNILRQTLDCCNDWSDVEILSGLEALAIRASVKAASGQKKGEKMRNKICRVLICIDGVDEADDWQAWRLRILECETWLVKFPLIRFIVSARSYPPMNMNPCDLPNNDLTQLREDLPESGDTLLYDLVPEYFEAYNIVYEKKYWIQGAFENALTLRLFCETHEGENVSAMSQDPMNFTLKSLLDIKINRLEDEFHAKHPRKFSRNDDIVRNTLFLLTDQFTDHPKLERDFLRNQLFDGLNQVLDKPTIGTLLDILTDHGFLLFQQVQSADGISPGKKTYSIGIQSYSEYLHAIKYASHIAQHKLLAMPTIFQEAQLEYTRTLTAIILFNDFNLLIGENGLWSNDLDTIKILRLQFQVFSQSPDNKIKAYLDIIRSKFRASNYIERDLTINEFILPNLYREELNLGMAIVHNTLIGFQDTYQRDLFWSAPDYHDFIDNSALSLYLEDVQLFPFDNYNGKPLVLVWSLSSPHKSYREKCRAEITDWAYTNIEGFIAILNLTFNCGDPQIQEDLCTIMLGLSAKFTKPDESQRLLADWILEHIFSDEQILILTNSVVRYGSSSYMERIYSFEHCTDDEIIRCRPPYKTGKYYLEVDLSVNELDTSHDGRFPIQDDLEWNVIDDAFKGFLHYEEGGLDITGREFMKPYIEQYGVNLNQHQFAVAAAIKYIKELGWNRTHGPANDGNSEWATFEEKYTWLAVHTIQGFLADRLHYGQFKSEGMLLDYGKILHIANPVEFNVGTLFHYYHIGADNWLIPEDIAEPLPANPKATQEDIQAWTTRPFIPDFKKWIELRKLQLNGVYHSADDWIALYSNTALPDPNGVGRARLTLNCVLIPESDLLEFNNFLKDPENRFDSNHDMRPDDMSASISHGVNHSLVDVIWMNRYDEEEPEKWITNQHNTGYQVKSTITEIHESKSGKQPKIYQVPSLLLRKGLKIQTTDTRGFFDEQEQLRFLMYKHWESDEAEQKITLVDRSSFEEFLKQNHLVPVWIAENYRSTISESRNKGSDNHWQNCTKWIVFNETFDHFQVHNDYHC